MLGVLSGSWALFLGLFLLMIGNGLQGTLLGLRGSLEGFTTLQMSVVMSGYFVGFLGGSRLAPEMIWRVGHVRVFVALGSMISAVLIAYSILAELWAWTIGRILIGFCFSGVYVTAESWLNNAATNQNRGKVLSLYMIVQLAGIVMAQFIITLGDIGGYILFIVLSILVSLAFVPILLSVSPTPSFAATKLLSLRELIKASPLASVGMALLGGVFAAQFGMAAYYANFIGLSIGQISIFISAIYVSALVLQYPIGWLSDRMDRCMLVLILSAIGAFGGLLGFLTAPNYSMMLIAAALVGGSANPLYALLIAYANDYLEHEDMAAASAGFVFINGAAVVADHQQE